MKQKNIVLMVVAVGCGLVAAFLTSQMSAKPTIEKIEVIVAAKDLPVGTQLSKEDLKTAVKRKSISKDSVPPTIIETEEELLEKRLTRTVHAEEMINKGDVTKGGVVSIPPGMSMATLPINLGEAVAGFVGPGSKVDVLASVKLENNLTVLPILVNMLVLAVDGKVVNAENGVYQSLSMVSFAVDRKQALLIKLARARNCDISLLLRHPEEKKSEMEQGYDIDAVTKMLQDNKNPAKLANPDEGVAAKKDTGKETVGAKETVVAPTPAAKIELVKVPAAAEEIPAGTLLTNDLIAEKFKLIELPKDLAADAVTDLTPLVGDKQVLRTGLGKGQWLTRSLFGNAEVKPSPRDVFNPDKAGPNESVKPAPVEVVLNKTQDISMHTASGTKVFRYEEVTPGVWKLQGEVKPNAKPGDKSKAPAPEKVD